MPFTSLNNSLKRLLQLPPPSLTQVLPVTNFASCATGPWAFARCRRRRAGRFQLRQTPVHHGCSAPRGAHSGDSGSPVADAPPPHRYGYCRSLRCPLPPDREPGVAAVGRLEFERAQPWLDHAAEAVSGPLVLSHAHGRSCGCTAEVSRRLCSECRCSGDVRQMLHRRLHDVLRDAPPHTTAESQNGAYRL